MIRLTVEGPRGALRSGEWLTATSFNSRGALLWKLVLSIPRIRVDWGAYYANVRLGDWGGYVLMSILGYLLGFDNIGLSSANLLVAFPTSWPSPSTSASASR